MGFKQHYASRLKVTLISIVKPRELEKDKTVIQGVNTT